MLKKASQRMRVFAGPNGSGKSTIIKEIQKLVTTGAYINADDIDSNIPAWVETYVLDKFII